MTSRRENWNQVYRARGEAAGAGALSGSDPEETLRYHDLTLRPGMVVLDIGVGMGYAARYYAEHGCTVDALDVSDLAAEVVRLWTRKVYLHDDLETLPAGAYDLAVSHLVAQHMDEPELLRQVKAVAKALKPGGIFSVHLAGSRRAEENNWTEPGIPSGFDGRMCRTEEYAVKLFRKALGKHYRVGPAGEVKEWPEFASYWHYIHVERKPEP